MISLPEPVPLDMPPGDPGAVDELVRDIAGAAFHLAGVSDLLRSPAASAPGWLGDDAVAAAGQVGRVVELAGTSAAAVLAAAGRLSIHAEVLRDTRRQVDALREEQDEDRRSAQLRLMDLADPRLAVMTGASGWAGVVQEFEAAEAVRRRRHAMLLDDLAEDAAATVRELIDAARPVGGTGRSGDGGRVLAHLALELPGWGVPELAGRGRSVADALTRSSLTPEERARLARDAVDLAAHPAFATALIRGVGTEGLGQLLGLLGQDPDGPDQPLAALLAAALGAAIPGSRPRDGVTAVLGATYVHRTDRHESNAMAAGMAAVLSAGSRLPAGGLRPETVGHWARQLLLREQVQKAPTGLSGSGVPWRGDARDPVHLAVETLADGGDPDAASALLDDTRVWEALLDRSWGDGGASLGDLVVLAGRADGAGGEQAVRLGLETIGAGLPAGDPDNRTVNRGTVMAIAPAIAEAVAAHGDVVAGELASAAAGDGQVSRELLAGLGLVTVDRQAAAAVEATLAAWTGLRGLDLAHDGWSAGPAAVAIDVPSAFAAVQEYGQRLAYALDGFELQEQAADRAAWWNMTLGMPLEGLSLLRVPVFALAATVAKAIAPTLLGMDGSFELGVDRGLRFGRNSAGQDALAALPPDVSAQVDAVRARAEESYGRTARLLGTPAPPIAPDEWRLAFESASGGISDAATGARLAEADRWGLSARSLLAWASALLPGR